MSTRVQINPKDRAEMIYIPAGSFTMGDDDDVIADYSTTPPKRSNPRHTVSPSGFYIYKNDVTVAMYKKYCQATGASMPPKPKWGGRDDRPIVNVTWDDAAKYCAWAGVALPTEAQWERSARGLDARKYPWGNEWDPSKLWCSTSKEGDAGGPDAVGSFPQGASPDGVLDMAGNVCQWCADWYDRDYWTSPRAKMTDPVNDAPGPFRVVRGGSWWYTEPFYYRTSFRYRFPPDFVSGDFGFRGVAGAPK